MTISNLNDDRRSYKYSIIKQTHLMIYTKFKQWDDYIFDENTQCHILKSDAIPCGWCVCNKEFKTLDELIVWLSLNCINNEGIMLNLRDKEATLFLDAWREANV